MTLDTNESPIPTSTAIMARIPLFEPTRKPAYAKNITHDENGVKLLKEITRVVDYTERVVKYELGEAKITGRLGQAHANVLESIMYNITDIISFDDTSMLVEVDVHRLRVSVGGGKKCNLDELDILIKELMAVVVDIKFRDFRIRGHLIDSVINDQKDVENPLSRINKISDQKKSIFKVKIGAAYMQIMDYDKIKINRDPSLIASLKSGVSQAVARLCSTHRDSPAAGWIIDNMIAKVGAAKFDENGKLNSQDMRNRRREIKNDKEGMSKCGIIVDGNRIHLNKSINKTVKN